MSVEYHSLLAGTPYSLDFERIASGELERLQEKEQRFRDRYEVVRSEAREQRLSIPMAEIQVTREIHESNAIEGLGPAEVAGTWEVRQSNAARQMRQAFDDAVFTNTIHNDPAVAAVLGLEGAKLLAERIRQDLGVERQISESDLRALHSQICAGESFAGMYKRYHVQIGGENAHEPHLPTDVSGAMAEFIYWLREAYEGPAILRAAAAHAWLTHIHPFEDGNGRVARLLANLILSEAGLPPAIVKNKSQRSAYLDALRHSDEGGDILPLAGLFAETTKRYIREVAKPQFLQRVFKNEILRRGSSYFDWWTKELETFTSRLESELGLHSLTMNRLGSLDRESFDYLKDLNPQGNSWLLTASDNSNHEVLFWFGYPSSAMRQRLPEKDYNPSIFFSVPQRELSLQPYRQADPGQLNGLTEMMLVPDVPTTMRLLINGKPRPVDHLDAAVLVSDVLAQAMAGRLVPTRWEAS